MSREYNFNFGWKYFEGMNKDIGKDRVGDGIYSDPRWLKSGNNGLSISTYDDNEWENVKLPHDFIIEKCDFTSEEVANVGSLRKTKAWYRKTFVLPEDTEDNRIFVRFDGVYRDSQVWCNGHFVGRHLGGYLGFTYELTEVIKRGEANTIAVEVDATGYEGWWYEGGGIYRDAFIIATPEIRVKENGIFVKPYNIDIDNKSCDVDVEIEVDSNKFGSSSAMCEIQIFDSCNQLVLTDEKEFTIDSFGYICLKTSYQINDVKLWDLTTNNMYKAVIRIKDCSKIDEVCQNFAIRSVTYSVEKGMFLNGQYIFLKGACGHDDFAGVGTALNRSIIEHKVKVLKSFGCNSYRCSHNPPSPIFLDVCDELGMLVMDETRIAGTSREVMEDFTDLIKRDRNHPSVLFFSMGNEEMNIQNNRTGTNIFSKMRAIGEKMDDSHFYMYAINADKNKNVDFIEGDGLHLPIHGVNYVTNRYTPVIDLLHERHPTCCFVSTETTGCCSVRGYKMNSLTRPRISPTSYEKGVWGNKNDVGVLTCYGDYSPMWGFTPEHSLQQHDGKLYMLGAYLWTGLDYRGEVSPFEFPQTVSSYGVVDLCGLFKDWAYYLKAWWVDEPMLHIFPSWNLNVPEGTEISVWAFANCDEVELVLNGKSFGIRKVERLGHVEWTVPYEKGLLEAYGFKNGEKILHTKLMTAEEEHQIVLSCDKTEILADHDDSTVVVVQVVDNKGNLVTNSEIDICFDISGAGSIKGVGNGNPQSVEHDKIPNRKLFAGKAIVIIESTFRAGDITLTAKSNDVNSASISIKAIATDCRDYIFSTDNVTYGSFRIKEIDL